MYQSRVLKRNAEKCIQCTSCETMLSGFITEHKGILIIPRFQFENESTQAAVEDIINCCIGNAISLETIV